MENIQRAYSKIKHKYTKYTGRLGSGSVGSVRFWLPECGSTDPDPKGNISNQKLRKNLFLSKTPSLNY